MKNLQTKEIYDKYIKEYVDKFMGLDLYADTFNHLLQLIPLAASVLDLGCGPGNVVKYLSSRRKDLTFLGVDIAAGMIEEAKRQNPGVCFRVMDIMDMPDVEQAFDVIVGAFCLPYLPRENVPRFFQNIKTISADNTWLYLSFMEGPALRSGWERTSFTGEDKLYINYYEREKIEALLKKHHFDIECLFTKDYPEMDGSSTTDLFTLQKDRDQNRQRWKY
jgi:SAM-dependent methyltransferase